MNEINGYQLSRAWFDFCFENPEKISPNHSAIFFFAIEHCNRLGWKEKFGFPTQMTMDAIGIKKPHTYIKYFNDLVEWGFFKLIQRSSNQYSANIICLQVAKPKNGKALGKAIFNHAAKQTQSNGQSIGPIDKPNNLITINQITIQEVEELLNDAIGDIYQKHEKPKWTEIDFDMEVKGFFSKVLGSPEEYGGRDIPSIRKAFQYQLRHAKKIFVKPNASTGKLVQ